MLDDITRLQNWARLAGFVTIFVSVIVCSFLYAISYPPLPGSGPTAQHNDSGAHAKQQTSARDQRGTKDEPLAVEIVPPKKGTPESDRYEKESLEKSSNERGLTVATWILAIATIVLFVFAGIQVALFYWQLRLIGDSLVDAKKAANAAADAADAAATNAEAVIDSERARFYVIIKTDTLNSLVQAATNYPNSPSMPVKGNVGIEYVFKNYGKTPAIYRENSHGIEMSFQPPDPTYSVSDQIPTQHMIEPGATTDEQICFGNLPIETIGDARKLVKGESYIWFFGRIDYTDVFGEQRTDRFLMRYIMMAGRWRFQAYDYKHYNRSSQASPPKRRGSA